MDVIMEFFSMDGYGGYVWPSYLVSAGLLVAMLVMSLRLLKANEATIKALETSAEDKTGEKKA